MTAAIFTTEFVPASGPTGPWNYTWVHLGDEKRVGNIKEISAKSFRAVRRRGEVGVDIRRVSTFRSFDAALAWITKQSDAVTWNTPIGDPPVVNA